MALPALTLVAGILLGLPIWAALTGAGIQGLYQVFGTWEVTLAQAGMASMSSVANYALSTVPMFILMAYFSESSGIAKDLYEVAARLLQRLRGGLAVATIFACMLFGAMSGSTVAAASVMSTIALPEMRRAGYSDVLAAGVVAVGATLSILIPPSIPMVVYGIATETSIGKLLVAGVLPGVLLGLLLMATVILWVMVRPYHAPSGPAVTQAPKGRSSLAQVVPVTTVFLLVIVALYAGVTTPTETAAAGALAAGAVGVLTGRLDWQRILMACRKTVVASAMVFTILMGTGIFAGYMALSGIPQRVVGVVAHAGVSGWLVIMGIMATYFVLSTFMDELPLLLITLQFTFPIIRALGFDPIWFGVISMMLVTMGLIFPPVGLNAFVVSSVSGIPLTTVYRGTVPLLVPVLVATGLLMAFPQIALWLPGTMQH